MDLSDFSERDEVKKIEKIKGFKARPKTGSRSRACKTTQFALQFEQ